MANERRSLRNDVCVMTLRTSYTGSTDKCIKLPYLPSLLLPMGSIWDSGDTVSFYLRGSFGEVVPSSDGVMCQMGHSQDFRGVGSHQVESA